MVLANISAGDSVTILGKTDSYYKVKYKNYTGYAMITYIDGASETLPPGVTPSSLASVTSYPYSTSTVVRAKLRKSADLESDVLTVVPQEGLITVYSVTSSGFAKAKYAGKTGWSSHSGDWVGHVAHGERQVREALGFAKAKTEPAVPVL